ncbi:MAG: response regulator [Nitrospiria bacterium]
MIKTIKNEPIKILLADDDEDDIAIALRAFKKSKLENEVFVVRDGEETLDYLLSRGQYQDESQHPKPHLLLLDINMPKMNGLEVLKQLEDHPTLKRLRVMMLTSSKNEEDVVRSYNNGACAYIPKPVEFDDFLNVVEGLNCFWRTVIYTNGY